MWMHPVGSLDIFLKVDLNLSPWLKILWAVLLLLWAARDQMEALKVLDGAAIAHSRRFRTWTKSMTSWCCYIGHKITPVALMLNMCLIIFSSFTLINHLFGCLSCTSSRCLVFFCSLTQSRFLKTSCLVKATAAMWCFGVELTRYKKKNDHT